MAFELDDLDDLLDLEYIEHNIFRGRSIDSTDPLTNAAIPCEN